MRRWATIAALALTLQLTGTDGNQNSTDSEAAARGTEDTDPIDDDDDDDSADDGDDAPTDGMFYRGMGMAQQQQQQIDTQGGDSKPNVHNGGVNLYPYTQELRDYIVQAHNWARGSLVPSQAANMRQLRWDESLAIEAAELVNTCVFEHETENYAYSQNLMYGGYSLDRATVDGWMDGWVQNELSPYDRSGTGYLDLDHASAVLWAKSYLVGCASKMCPNGYLTACNYFTQGNWQGEQAYIPGPSCSQCPSQAPYCDATGKLCTADLTGATPPSKPNQSPVQTAAPTSTARAPAATPAKTAPSHAANVTPAPTPQATIPHELCD
ncbi:hypothetical protein PybrP1_005056 [[Pythium] brassicae (nom. inval.)]|nr:hypothetical protein PybrP1_005056 [[Pythium] brassicae (nom. inval.)]